MPPPAAGPLTRDPPHCHLQTLHILELVCTDLGRSALQGWGCLSEAGVKAVVAGPTAADGGGYGQPAALPVSDGRDAGAMPTSLTHNSLP